MRYFNCFAAASTLLGAVLVGCNKQPESDVVPVPTEQVEVTTVSFANTKCPIMGGKPTAELTAEYEGKTIGFCCEGCPEKWEKLSAEQKSEKFAKVDAHAEGEHADQSEHAQSDHASESE